MMKILKIATYISLIFFSQWSHSIDLTDEEVARLDPICQARMKAGSSEYAMWAKRLASGWQDSHHYCFGTHFLNLANKTIDKDKRRGLLNSAAAEMEYTRIHTSDEYKLKPKIYYDIGQVREGLDDEAGAIQAYFYSIKLNPNLPKPYAALSDLYKKQNNSKQAIAILEEGLKYKPKSKTLLKRLEKLSKEK
jgi:tetratricopeptide (TPR) repeat protein